MTRTWLAAALAAWTSTACYAGDYELGQYLSGECTGCHQLSGVSAGGIPAITGWPEDQFIAVMRAFQTKQRDNAVMQTIAGRLGADDIAALAAFFAKQPAR